MKKLKQRGFEFPEELTEFVNSNEIEIVSIVTLSLLAKSFTLFYY